MAARGDLAQQCAVALRHPAEREERRLGLDLVEQVEDLAHVAVDPVGEASPLVALDHVLERADLEPVLDVDREPVDDRPAGLGTPFGERNRIHSGSPLMPAQAALVWSISVSIHSISMVSVWR